MNSERPLRIAVLVSGSGTNLQALIQASQKRESGFVVAFVASNKENAGGLKRAKQAGIPAYYISKKTHGSQLEADQAIYEKITAHNVSLLCLAGYLKKVTPWLVKRMPQAIINIHPGLLPFLGGKGMYGQRVHAKVLELGMKVTGVSIHFVDEIYDHGPIIAQRCVPVEPNDTVDTLAERVLETEHALYVEVVKAFATGRVTLKNGRVWIHDH